MSENVINGLMRQSETILEVIDDVRKLLNDAQDQLNKNNLDDEVMFYLTQAVNRMLTLANTYLKNFNAFMDEQLKPNKQKSM